MDTSHMTNKWISHGNYSQLDVMLLRDEVRRLQQLESWAHHAIDWFQDNDELHVNSKAYVELERIMKEKK